LLNQPAFQLDIQIPSWFLVVSTTSSNASNQCWLFQLFPGWFLVDSWINQRFNWTWLNQPCQWLFQQPTHFRRRQPICRLIGVFAPHSRQWL